MNDPVKVLLVFVKETDMWGDTPLYKAVVQKLRQLEVAGATAQVGLTGFGRHHRVHHKGLFGIADDRPITIMAADSEAKLRAAIPELQPLLQNSVFLLLDAELGATEPRP
jgi:PII-like signaling protein